MTIQHLRSSTANKRPTPAAMSDGQLAVNTNTASPGLFFKDSAGALIKVGPVHVGTTAPNASPAGGGETGNTVGEQWLDTAGGTYVFKVWDGSAWRSESGTFVDVNGDVMTGALGIIAGSAGSPGLYFSGDTNTGLYSPGADQVAISTGGSGRLFVDASGNVSIGAQSSSAPLVVTTTAGANIRASRNSKNLDIIANYGGSNERSHIHADSGMALTFGTGGDIERLRITSAGLVGVGTSTVDYALDVRGTNPRVQIKQSSASDLSLFQTVDNAGNAFFIGTDNSTGSNFAQGNYARLIYSQGTAPLRISTNGTHAVTIDSSQRVGIGTTGPNAALDVAVARSATVDSAIFGTTGTGVVADVNRILIKNVNTLGGQNQGVGIGGVLAASASNEAHLTFYSNPGSGVTERARIDSSGRLLVGTSSSASTGAESQYSKLQVVGNAFSAAGHGVLSLGRGEGATNITANEAIGFISFSDNTGGEFAYISCLADANAGTNDYPGRLVFSTTADGASSPTERMRIGQNGYIKASNSGSYAVTNIATGTEAYHQIISNAANLTLLTSARDSGGTAHASSVTSTTATGDLYRGYVEASGAIVYRVFSNGNVQNTNGSYTTLSDAKLKENIVDAGSQWDDLKAIQIRNWNFKAETGHETHRQIGPIAQELETVCPGLVFETPDRDADGNETGDVTKGVNQSVLYMKAVKALQEAMERIETLEAKVAALEAA